MTDSKGRFEALNHIVYGGDKQNVPLYVEHREGVVEDTKALYHAADIIGGNLHLFGGEVKNLSQIVDYLVSEDNDAPQEAIIISDSHGAGAVSVDQKNTEVTIQGVGNWAVESSLFAGMVRAWAKYEEEK